MATCKGKEVFRAFLLFVVAAATSVGLTGCATQQTEATKQYNRSQENYESERKAAFGCIKAQVRTPVGRRVAAVFFPVDGLPNKAQKLANPDLVSSVQAADLMELVRMTRPCRSKYTMAASFISQEAVDIQQTWMTDNDADIAALTKREMTIGQFNERYLRREKETQQKIAEAKAAAFQHYRAMHKAEIARRKASAN